MPNLRGASPVGRDDGGRSNATQTVGGVESRGVGAAAVMNTVESMECTRRRGRELGLSAGTVTTPREGLVTSTFRAAPGEGNVTIDREGGSEASWSGTPEDDWMSGLGGGEVYDGRRVRGETVRRRMKPSSCQTGSWCRVNSGSDRGDG